MFLNRKQRRNWVKAQNRARLEVNDGAFGDSKKPRMLAKDLPKGTREEAEKFRKYLEKHTIDLEKLRKKLRKEAKKFAIEGEVVTFKDISKIAAKIEMKKEEEKKQEIVEKVVK